VGAWLGIVIALGFGLVLYLWKSNKKKLIWFIIVLGLILILAISYLKLFSEQGKTSFNARLIIWEKAWHVFSGHPIIGLGPGTFEAYFPSFPIWGVPQPHNLYLAFLLQTGIIGFIGFVWILIWFFKKGFELLKAQNLLSITLMSVMVYILIHGLVDTTYWKNDLSIAFWVIIALLNIVDH
jgi:putative inorganic carbon (HCO3(-)) transporter